MVMMMMTMMVMMTMMMMMMMIMMMMNIYLECFCVDVAYKGCCGRRLENVSTSLFVQARKSHYRHMPDNFHVPVESRA